MIARFISVIRRFYPLRRRNHLRIFTRTARVKLDRSGTLTKNSIEHTLHENHDHIYADMKSVNNIKTEIRSLRNEYPEIVHNISVENIFYKEIAR